MARSQVSSLSPISAVLFDLDGVLVDSFTATREYYHLVLGAVESRRSDSSYPRFLDLCTVLSRHDFLSLAAERYGVPREELLASAERIAYPVGDLRVPSDTQLLIAELRDLMPVGIVTSRLRAEALQIINADLNDDVEVLVAFEDSNETKPSPGPLLDACSLLGVQPALAVYVGDNQSDAVAAASAGMRFVSVGQQMRPTAAADYAVPSLYELRDRLPRSLKRIKQDLIDGLT